MSSELLPPAQPAFILRGHSAQIHALHFTKGNARLLTADADGWIVSWNLAFKRPVAVWRAHSNAILGVGSWGSDRIITHGRDDKLLVWQLGLQDEAVLDETLPVDAPASAKQPWLLHALTVNTLNFCPFSMCKDGMPQVLCAQQALKDKNQPEPILIAVPNTVDSGGIDIYQLPMQTRAANISSDRSITSGMVMALSILADSTRIQLAAGYESGHTMVFIQTDPAAAFQKLYSAHPHTQPVLSMAISPSTKDHYITTSADANVAKHPFPASKSIWNTELKPIKVAPTKHSGQQGIAYRSDGKIYATAGWDSHVRIYSGKTMKELAVLKWHKVGCYATAFAEMVDPTSHTSASDQQPPKEVGEEGSGSEKALSATSTVQRRRDEKARTTHWLAAGAKDGKVSLWDIY